MSVDLISGLLAATPGWADLSARTGLDADDVSAILGEADRVARDVLDPLAANADAQGCRVEGGRVKVPDGYRAAYQQLGQDGWLTADVPEDFGGQGLPTAMHAATSLFFEGAAMPFMMANGSSRAGLHLLAENAPALAAEWGPRLAAGDWAMTICISEPDAGSDVGRIRTKAVQTGNGWQLSGTKCWISFGDQNMTDRIGHLALARTGMPEDGTRGLSLFLVPSTTDDGAPNGIHIERIEEKLGLHGSPTCVMRFEGAEGRLIGPQGRGLPTLFAMIELMRLQTGCQGAGIALRCAELARSYAQDRLQGGAPDQPPVPIASHPDVKRQLTAIEAKAAIIAALVIEAAVALDLARGGDQAAADLAAFLLPLAKNFGGEVAFDVASSTIQVLGGAGYTREWPAERYLRDARIITIYEGTTGMQGQDFLMRRLLRDKGAGLRAFADRVAAELDTRPDAPETATTRALMERFTALSARLADGSQPVDTLLLRADGYLRAGWAVLSMTLAGRVATLGEDGARLARYWSHFAHSELTAAEVACTLTPDQVG